MTRHLKTHRQQSPGERAISELRYHLPLDVPERHIDSGFYRVTDKEAGLLAKGVGAKLPPVGKELRVELVDGSLAWLQRVKYSGNMGGLYVGDAPKRGWVWAIDLGRSAATPNSHVWANAVDDDGDDDGEHVRLEDGVFSEADLRWLTPDDRARWEGYNLRLYRAIYSKKEWEDIGDTANRTVQLSSPFLTLEALVRHLIPLELKWEKQQGGVSTTWFEPSSIAGKAKKSRQGGVTQTDASIERKDGLPLNEDEIAFLGRALNIPRKRRS